jgi:hypothetical protein
MLVVVLELEIFVQRKDHELYLHRKFAELGEAGSGKPLLQLKCECKRDFRVFSEFLYSYNAQFWIVLCDLECHWTILFINCDLSNKTPTLPIF